MIESNPFDKPAVLAFIAIIYIQVMAILDILPLIAFSIQIAIGLLTIVYLIHKILHIRKLNKTIFSHEQKEEHRNEHD